jgi:glutaredoxin 3
VPPKTVLQYGKADTTTLGRFCVSPIFIESSMMNKITMYSTLSCPYCVDAEQLMQQKGIAYDKILVDRDPGGLSKMIQRLGRRSVPQLFIGETHIGGFDDLNALELAGGLAHLSAPATDAA